MRRSPCRLDGALSQRQCIAACVTACLLGVTIASNASETPHATLQWSGARIAAIGNPRTGGRLACPPEGTLAVRRMADRTLLTPQNEARRTDAHGTTVESFWADARAVSTFRSRPDGEVSVRQTMDTRSAAAGVSWGLVLPDSARVLVPADGGLRFDKSSPLLSEVFEYPRNWQSACVLIDTGTGGWLIYAADADMLTRWVVLLIERREGQIHVRFETRNSAPFRDKRRVESADWRIHAYPGDWTAGAEVYRRQAARRFGLRSLPQRSPIWASQIRSVVITEASTELIDPLTKVCDPRQTLLYAPDWRVSPYDIQYPDYRPSPRFVTFVQAAHRRGFRVMAHVNPYACDANHPLYAQHAAHKMRMEFHDQSHWYDTPNTNPPVRFAFINPASSAWHREFIRRMVQLVRETGVDALHLDTSLCMYNDGNGPVDGLNSMQGAVRLHRELVSALPDVALSGEGVNEILAGWQHFAQYHAWGYNGQNQTFDNHRLTMVHPIAEFLLSPYITIYGHLGTPNPGDFPQGWLAWMRGALPAGQIPTLKWPSASQLIHPTPCMASQLHLMRVQQAMRLNTDLSAGWPDHLAMRWRGQAGSKAEALLLPDGMLLRTQARHTAPWSTELRWVEGVSRWSGPGSLVDWHAWKGQAAIGLDPNVRYLWSPKAWPDIPHISGLSAQSIDASLTVLEQVAVLHAAPADQSGMPEGAIPLWKRPVTLGLTLQNGNTIASPQIALEHPSGAAIERRGEGFYLHPPWKSDSEGQTATLRRPGPGAVWVEWALPENAAEMTLEAQAQLLEGAVQSDGVVFEVEVKDHLGAVIRQAEATAVPRRNDVLSLPLGGLTNARTLRITVWPGPNGDATFDWGFLNRPLLRPTRPRAPGVLQIDVENLPSVWVPLVSSGQVTPLNTGAWRTTGYEPLLTVFGRADLQRVNPPADLLTIPPIVHAVTPSGQSQPIANHMQPQVSATLIANESRMARNAHPPDRGVLAHGWLVEAGGKPLRLRAMAGIAANPQSDGVLFRIRVNGQEVAKKGVKPGDPWTPIQVVLPPMNRFWLSLETEPGATSAFDWAYWADIQLDIRPE